MKTISEYSIHCTPEQTRKALALGAQLEYSTDYSLLINGVPYEIPTAEEMIGWLEAQEGIHEVRVNQNSCLEWYFCVCGQVENKFKTRKEATHAAIDAALKYLSENVK